MKKNNSNKDQQLSLFEKDIKVERDKMGKIVDFLKHKEKKELKDLYNRVDKMLSHLSKRKQK